MPGAAIKRQGSRFDAWIASPLLPAKLFGNLAREAGAHLFVEPGVALFGKGNIFSLQSDKTDAVSFTPRCSEQHAKNILTSDIYHAQNGKIIVDIVKDEPVLIRLITED